MAKELSPLQRKACEAYGIPEKCVFAAAEKEGTATIVTNGGTKIRYQDKQGPVKRLTPAQLGLPPKKPEAAAEDEGKK